jgi:predicted DNA-binding protein with PD1-like motif
MKSASSTSSTHILRLDPGDDICPAIERFCQENGINNAKIEAIGSVESPTLAHYSIHSKKYSKKILDGIYEITALIGNIAILDGHPKTHLHATLADSEMRSFGGHLVKGECSATVEVFITSFPSSYRKTHNESIGLNIWDFDVPR